MILVHRMVAGGIQKEVRVCILLLMVLQSHALHQDVWTVIFLVTNGQAWVSAIKILITCQKAVHFPAMLVVPVTLQSLPYQQTLQLAALTRTLMLSVSHGKSRDFAFILTRNTCRLTARCLADFVASNALIARTARKMRAALMEHVQ